MQGWLSILLLMLLAAGFGAGLTLLSRLLGPRNPTPEKLAPYECGMAPVGDARERQSVRFYLVAIVFMLLDIEVAFLYPWAVNLRMLGMFGFVEALIFIAILVVGLVYAWGRGALDWS